MFLVDGLTFTTLLVANKVPLRPHMTPLTGDSHVFIAHPPTASTSLKPKVTCNGIVPPLSARQARQTNQPSLGDANLPSPPPTNLEIVRSRLELDDYFLLFPFHSFSLLFLLQLDEAPPDVPHCRSLPCVTNGVGLASKIPRIRRLQLQPLSPSFLPLVSSRRLSSYARDCLLS